MLFFHFILFVANRLYCNYVTVVQIKSIKRNSNRSYFLFSAFGFGNDIEDRVIRSFLYVWVI